MSKMNASLKRIESLSRIDLLRSFLPNFVDKDSAKQRLSGAYQKPGTRSSEGRQQRRHDMNRGAHWAVHERHHFVESCGWSFEGESCSKKTGSSQVHLSVPNHEEWSASVSAQVRANILEIWKCNAASSEWRQKNSATLSHTPLSTLYSSQTCLQF